MCRRPGVNAGPLNRHPPGNGSHRCEPDLMSGQVVAESHGSILEDPLKRTMMLLAALALVATACAQSETAETPAADVPLATTTTAAPTTTTAAPTTTTAAPVTTTTAAPVTTTTAANIGIVPGDDPDVDAVVLAYQIVFSSETRYEEKVPYLEEPDGLEETVAMYQETGESMGGVALAASAVTINGDTADVTYDLLFGGTPTYPDLSGDAVLRDGTWKITRDMFSAMMASARVGCPTS